MSNWTYLMARRCIFFFFGASACARRRLLPLVVELRTKVLVVVSGLAGLLGPRTASPPVRSKTERYKNNFLSRPLKKCLFFFTPAPKQRAASLVKEAALLYLVIICTYSDNSFLLLPTGTNQLKVSSTASTL